MDIESQLNRRLDYKKEFKFNISQKQNCKGRISDLSKTEVFFTSEEFIPMNSEVMVFITMELMGDSMEIALLGLVTGVDRSLPKPLRGYGVEFHKENPEVMVKALEKLVDSLKAPAPRAPVTPPLSSKPTQREQSPMPKKSVAPPSPEKKRPVIESPLAEPKNFKIALGAVLLLLVFFAAFHFSRGGRLVSRFPEVVPVKSIRSDDRDLRVTVSRKWAQETSKDEIEGSLRLIGEEFLSDKLNGIYFLDDDGKQVALIMFVKGGQETRVNIRIYK